MMKNLKILSNGIIVSVLTFVYWLFIMTVGDQFRMQHPEYRSEITFGFIISAIILNIILVYFFYSKSPIQNSKTIFFLAMPYLILLIGTQIFSQFIPRILDVLFIIIGSYLIYKIKESKIEKNKSIILLGGYLCVICLSYTYLFNCIQSYTGQY